MNLEYWIMIGFSLILIVALIIGLVYYQHSFKISPPSRSGMGTFIDLYPDQDTTPVDNEDFGMYEDSLMQWLDSHPPNSYKDFARIKNVGSLNIPPNLQKPFEFDANRFKTQVPGNIQTPINPDFKHFTRHLD